MSVEDEPARIVGTPLTAPAATRDDLDVPSVWAFMLPVLLDAGLPTAAYYLARATGRSAYVALLAGTVVAGLRVGYVAVRARRFDAIAAFLLAVFGIGLALSFMTGSARFLLAKDSIPTATTGLIFLGTGLAGRPLTYAWGVRIMARTPDQQRLWAARWAAEPAFRRVFYVMSWTWGWALLLEAAVRLPLVYAVPTDVMAGLSSLLSVGTIGALAVWTVWYARWVQG